MINKEYEKELFKDELNILEAALSDISDENYKNNELMSKYKELTSNYKKLLKLSSKIFKISDTQGKDLKRRENDIKNLLDNSSQGFLTFGKDMLIDREYSSECTRIFNKKIAGLNIIELLSNGSFELQELFTSNFNDIFNKSFTGSLYTYIEKLPNVIKINESYINIKYRIIENTDYETGNDTIMLILTDITEMRRAEDQVLFLSYHDKLTSLYNRGYIDSIIPQLQSSANLPLSIIMADMNGLKLTNDVFGHEQGDKLLVNLASILQNSCRRSDIVARWGGDEFLMLLPGTDNNACEAVCKRIKRYCSSLDDDPIELSVSLGTATMETHNVRISDLFSIAENMMYSNKMTESKSVRKKIILSVENILHTKCFENFEHNVRMKQMAFKFATLLKLEPESMDMINLAMLATLHDIGKVAIPREILGKPGPLTKNEWKIMQSHTEIGFRMAQSIEEPALAQAILAMRERWDGKGYPYGLKGEQIPLITRIISIIDAYDVMTHERPYKKKLTSEEAVDELQKHSSMQFDPYLVKLFLDNLDSII